VSDLETLWKRLDESGGDVIESAQGGTKARMLADILNFGSEQGGQQGGLPFDNQTFKKSFLEMMKWQGHGNLGQDLGNAPAAWESLIAKELGRHTEQAYGQPQRQRNPNPIRHIQDPNNSKHHYFTNRYAESGDVDHMSPSSERLHGMIRNQWLDEQSAGGEGAAAGAAPGGEGAAAGLKLAAPGGRSGSIRMTNADKMLDMMEQDKLIGESLNVAGQDHVRPQYQIGTNPDGSPIIHQEESLRDRRNRRRDASGWENVSKGHGPSQRWGKKSAETVQAEQEKVAAGKRAKQDAKGPYGKRTADPISGILSFIMDIFQKTPKGAPGSGHGSDLWQNLIGAPGSPSQEHANRIALTDGPNWRDEELNITRTGQGWQKTLLERAKRIAKRSK
jgi:hypothetical protein